MKNALVALLTLVALIALVWFVWANWDTQLSHLPAQFARAFSRLLSNFTDSLAGFGQGLRDSFQMPVK